MKTKKTIPEILPIETITGNVVKMIREHLQEQDEALRLILPDDVVNEIGCGDMALIDDIKDSFELNFDIALNILKELKSADIDFRKLVKFIADEEPEKLYGWVEDEGCTILKIRNLSDQILFDELTQDDRFIELEII